MKKAIYSLMLVMVAFICLLTGCGKKDEPSSKQAEEQTITHTVTFYVEAGVQYGEKVVVNDGEKVTKPAVDPTKEDDANIYTFEYWHMAGEQAEFNFQTPIKEDTKLYAKFSQVAKEYDFVAYIWQGDVENVYITDDEATQIASTITASDLLKDKRVLVFPVSGKTRNAFVSEVLANGKVDLAFGGANLSPKERVEGTEYLDIDTTDSENDGHLAKLGAGWTANSSRYVGVLNTSTHKETAIALYNTFVAQGPDFATLDKYNVTLKNAETVKIEVTGTEKTVVWSSSDDEVASVENGTITAVGEGECKIFAKVGAVVYEVEVTVDNKDYGLVVWVNGMSDSRITTAESDRMQQYVSELLPEGKELKWEYFTVAEKEFVLNAQNAAIDMVISSSNLSGADSFGDDRKVSFDEAGPKARVGGTNVDNGWLENASRYVGITAQVDPEHKDTAIAAYKLLTSVGPDHVISTAMSEIILEVEGTEKFVVSAFGDVTFESSAPTKVSVAEDGTITALEPTEEAVVVTATDAKNNKVQVNVTVTAAPIVPNHDLYVWINLREDKDWMSEADLARLVEAAKVEGKVVTIEKRTESKVADVKTAQAAMAATDRVDIIIGRDALGTNSGAYKTEVDEGKVARYPFAASWGYDDGYIYVMEDVIEAHQELVASFVSMVTKEVPGYFEMDKVVNIDLAEGNTYTLAPTLDGAPATGVSFVSNNTDVATVDETGLVTALATGEAVITATRDIYYANCTVKVTRTEAGTFELVIYVNANVDKAAIEAEYTKVKDENCQVTWVVGQKTKVADCSAEVMAWDNTEGNTKINVIMGHTQMTSGHANGLVNDTNGYSVYEPRYNMKSELVSGAPTNYYMAITSDTTGKAYDEALKIATIVAAA